MARWIDADKALKVVFDQGLAHPNAYHLTNYATLILREAPTVDAVEVVRCRECKHYDTADFDGDILCGCTLHSAMVDITPDSFCSCGERSLQWMN